MAYLNQVSKSEERTLDAEAIANTAGLVIHTGIKATKASGRGFWQGLRGNVYIPDDQVPAPKARTARR